MPNAKVGEAGVAPLLRWAGSKRKLLPELMKHVPLSYTRYLEPFCGSACLFFAVRPKAAILADLNDDLIHTYAVLKAHPRLLYRAVAKMPRTKAQYYDLRDKVPTALENVDRAARFVYLNRNCFNGVYRTNRSGKFNVPRGRRMGELPTESQFVRCAKALRGTELIHGDFEPVLSQVRAGDFVYLDPPYAKRGARRRGEYGYSSFDTRDLSRLGECLRDLDKKGATFLLSYSDCQEIRDITLGWYKRTLLVRRHVAGFQQHRARVREILLSNKSLIP